MSIGENIRKYRNEMKDGSKLSQEKLAEKIGVTFQAVSSWERDEYKPDLSNLIALADVLDVSLDAIVNDRKGDFKTKKALFDWEHMKTFVKTTAKNLNLTNTLKAIDYAEEAHRNGPTRKNSDIPYISHPLNMACHALAMGITEDEILAAILLHDVIEDCRKTLDDLPVNDETKELVWLMTRKNKERTISKTKEEYYEALAENPKAALIKCIDRCNNMTTMSWGLSRNGIFNYIDEVDRYYPALFKAIKDTPEYNNAAWLLKYQIESMQDIYKRLM